MERPNWPGTPLGDALLDALFTEAPQAVAVHDAEGRLVTGNESYERHFGIRLADVPANYSLFTDPQLHESGLIALIRRAYSGERITLPPIRYDAAQATGGAGRSIWTQGRCHPVYRDGMLLYVAIVHTDVTAHMESEGALRAAHDELASAEALRQRAEASETLARQIFMLSPLPKWVYDFETLQFLDVNDAAVRRYGWSREEFLAMTIRDIRPPEEIPRMLSVAKAPHPTGDSGGVFHHRTKSGEVLDIEVFLRDVLYNGRRAVIAVVHDITPRRRAEQELIEAKRGAEAARDAADRERRTLLAVLEQLPVGVHVAEAPSGKLVLDNAAVREICGEAPKSEGLEQYSADYAGFYPIGHPRAGEQIASHEWPLSHALSTGASVRAELVEFRRADGTRRMVSVSAAPVRDAEGRVVGGVATSVDVTERERLLAQSEAAREQLTSVLESIGDAFYAVDAEFRFTYVNRKAETLWGRRREDLIGRHYWTEFPQAVGSESYHRHQMVMGERRPVHYETISPVIARWIDVSIYPEANGGLACYFRDITDRREAEAAREAAVAGAEAARAEAEAANRAKSEFLAVMSHELRTPLNAIGGYAELIEMGIRGPITPLQREDLRRLQASQRHLLGLINEVLNYARLETGTVHFDMAPVSVCEALAEAETLVSPQARTRGLSLEVKECSDNVTANADAEKVRQILVNLLSNAVKFTDRGGRITLTCSDHDEFVEVRVRDTGIGIAPDQRERIFDPFVQVRSDLSRTAEGTGLGLAISRDLARAMGGDLLVESTHGEGSTFILRLPRG